MVYRISMPASICFSVIAGDEEAALERAREVIRDEETLPECFEMKGPRSVCIYPLFDEEENLEAESSWEEQTQIIDAALVELDRKAQS